MIGRRALLTPTPMNAPSSIGHYRLTNKLGEGGMGAVYRARDTKLNRDVAVKLLRAIFAQDTSRLHRFELEARVLASLNHPNIATIYGVEEGAIVMELVEGESLRVPLPPHTALDYACQIAEALEAAHEKGIIHRDLKPANIMVTPSGVVKVLDFGLAKNEVAVTRNASSTISATLTLGETEPGMIIGTAAYMAPEQAAGRPVDRRADIWSFGVVLYEMLSGSRLFEGETVAHTMAEVLTKDINLSAIDPTLRPLVRRCLQRDPRKRLRDIGDARLAIEDHLLDPKPAVTAAAPPRGIGVLPWIAAAILACAGGAGWWKVSRPEPARPLLRLHLDLPENVSLRQGQTGGIIAISPDGGRLALVLQKGASTILAERQMSQDRLTQLSGTEDAASPFFSPDGEWIGFAAGGKLKKVSVNGGTPIILCDAPGLRGASWGKDGNIVAALRVAGPLFQVPASGGTPVELTHLEANDRSHRWPQLLPGGRSVLFTDNFTPGNYDDADIVAFSFETGKRKMIQHGGFYARYLPGGYLTWVRNNTLFAAPFDLDRLAPTGEAVPLLDDVRRAGNVGADLDSSATGILLYHSGKAETRDRVLWADEAGTLTPLATAPGVYYHPAISPDGKRLAYQFTTGSDVDIWVRDLKRDVASRLTFMGGSYSPVWTPDGRNVVFNGGDSKTRGIYAIRSDGSGTPKLIGEAVAADRTYSFSPDGKRLAIEHARDIYIASVEGDADHSHLGRRELLVGTPASEGNAMFSPDGKWIAYSSDTTGVTEVFVQPYPGPGGRWQISQQGGSFPRWSRHGQELLYVVGGRVMRVSYTVSGDSFVAGRPRPWPGVELGDLGGAYAYTVAPNGTKLIAVSPPQNASVAKADTRLNVLVNFFDEVKRRVRR
ncbi:MAG: serine/threonine protein kinase [Bryobacterales bacterium]|nr:serine/threonine protein kinase [Bryobacterales bacterium]